jgi:HAMP domain-containing protein
LWRFKHLLCVLMVVILSLCRALFLNFAAGARLAPHRRLHDRYQRGSVRNKPPEPVSVHTWTPPAQEADKILILIAQGDPATCSGEELRPPWYCCQHAEIRNLRVLRKSLTRLDTMQRDPLDLPLHPADVRQTVFDVLDKRSAFQSMRSCAAIRLAFTTCTCL